MKNEDTAPRDILKPQNGTVEFRSHNFAWASQFTYCVILLSSQGTPSILDFFLKADFLADLHI
jgi:hypothetical protein